MYPQPPENRYRVRVGHIEVVVAAESDDEAITNARLQIIDELPRFYDVIHTLDVSRFEVLPAA